MNRQTDRELIIEEGGLNLRAEGPFTAEKTYFPSKKLRSETHYQNGHLQGRSVFFSEQGKILSESWFWEGKKVSVCRQFYPSDAPYAILPFKEGRKEGRHEYFYENGQLKTLEHFAHGKLDGPSTLYWPNGQIKREAHFSQGIRCGWDRMFTESGELIEEEQYVS